MEETQKQNQLGIITPVLYELVSSLIMALIAVTVIFTLFFRVVSVNGDSMLHTLHNGEKLILISQFYVPEHGDIVVINREGEDPLIKRVIAVAGDTIAIDSQSGKVMRNGAALDEPYINGDYTPDFGFTGTYAVPAGYVFVMGDNRGNSLDSRQLGAFPLEQVVGEVAWRLSPFGEV